MVVVVVPVVVPGVVVVVGPVVAAVEVAAKVRDPIEESIISVTDTAIKTGDNSTISKQDVSIIALALENDLELITDDFAVTNVAKQLKIKTSSLMTKGISIVGKWISYCSICGKEFSKQKECPICGSKLNRKLIKKSI